MTDWFQNLMSGFGRAVQIVGANQSQQEQEAEQASDTGASLAGALGVAAALGNVAANASSTGALKRPETVSGTLDLIPDTAFIVLQTALHTPVGGGPPVPAIVARLVPGRVWLTGTRTELAWGDARYSGEVATVYLTGTTYRFVPTIGNYPAGATPAQTQQFNDFNAVRTLCRAYFGGTSAIATHLGNNAQFSGHYYVDQVFTQQPTLWALQANPNAPVVRQPLLTPGRRDRTSVVFGIPSTTGGSNVGVIYHLWDAALKVVVTWPQQPDGTKQNSGSVTAGAMAAVGAGVVVPVFAFNPSPRHSGMLLQGGNFVAGLFLDHNSSVIPQLLAAPGFIQPNSRIYTNTNALAGGPVPANTPVHYDLSGQAPIGTVPNPLVLVNFANAPAAAAINTAQPATLVLSRTCQALSGPWVSQGGTFPVGGGTLSPLLPPTTVFADGVAATSWTNTTGTALQANRDYYLTLTPGTPPTPGGISQPVGNAAPTLPNGTLLISRTTTDAVGVTASTLLLPGQIPVIQGIWLETYSIPLGNLNPGEMNRVSVTITQPVPGQFQVATTVNETAVGGAVAINQVQFA